VNLEELEQEIRMHRRGRRRELLILWAVAAVFLVALAGVVLLLL
jgi:hypothetical protein